MISDQSATLQTSKVTGDARRGHTNPGSQLVRTAALRLDRSSPVPNESQLTTLSESIKQTGNEIST